MTPRERQKLVARMFNALGKELKEMGKVDYATFKKQRHGNGKTKLVAEVYLDTEIVDATIRAEI